MKRILVVGEGALCCALGERLMAAGLPGWMPGAAQIKGLLANNLSNSA